MKSLYTLLLCAVVFLSCESEKKDPNQRLLPASNGNINTISVVVDNLLWDSNVGEAIRDIFAAPLLGLPQDEALFKMRQIPPQVFDGFATKSRIILKIEKGAETAETKIYNEAYAKPQTVAVVRGKFDRDIIAQLKDSKAKIIDAFNKEEVKEKQRRIKLSLLDDKDIETALGFKINIPSAYRIGKSDKDFFWVRKSITNSKTMDLMFYETPIDAITKGDSTIVDLITLRNKITKTRIPGEDDIYMAVEDIYTPALFSTIIDNKPTYEVRGVWRVKNQYMSGPFVTYAIEDKVNKRYIIADGYVYAPSLPKRDYIFEIESIIKSIVVK